MATPGPQIIDMVPAVPWDRSEWVAPRLVEPDIKEQTFTPRYYSVEVPIYAKSAAFKQAQEYNARSVMYGNHVKRARR